MKDNVIFVCIFSIAVMFGCWTWRNWNPAPNPDLAQLRADIRDLRSQMYEMRVQEVDATYQKCALKERIIITLLDAQANMYKADDPMRYRSIMSSAYLHDEILKTLER